MNSIPSEEELKKGSLTLPNGCTLYWKLNEVGGRTYYSDEIGGGAVVWDTALIDQSTLLAALVQESSLNVLEHYLKEKETSLYGSPNEV